MGEQGGGSGWKTYAKVGGIVLLVIALLGAIPFLAGNLRDGADPPWWVGPLILAVGALTFYLGFRAYRHRQLVRDTPTSKVRSLAIGTAEVQGSAQPLAEPLVSPLTHTPACMFELKVEEEIEVETEDEDGHRRRRDEWRTVFTLKEQIPFCIDDGTGRVPVQSDGAELDIAVEDEVEVDERQAPPAPLGEWVDEHGSDQRDIRLPGQLGEMVDALREGDTDPTEMDPEDFRQKAVELQEEHPDALDPEDMKLGSFIYGRAKEKATSAGSSRTGSLWDLLRGVSRATSDEDVIHTTSSSASGLEYLKESTPNKRRFEERVLAVDEPTYVFGSAQRLPEADSIENAENLVLEDDPSTGLFLVSDKPPDRLLDDGLVRSVAGLGTAAVCVPYGIIVMLASVGLL